MLVFALLAALVVPGINGRPTGGTADRVPIPQPPKAGECLKEIQLRYVDHTPEVEFSTGQFGSCAGPKVGEVVGLLDASASSFEIDNRAGTAGAGSTERYFELDHQCFLQAVAFTGLQRGPQGVIHPGISTEEVDWRPAFQLFQALVGPTGEQRLLGADWLVCAIGTAKNGITSSYQGTMREGFTVGDQPDAVGTCSWSPGHFSQTWCDENHRYQLLATVSLPGDGAGLPAEQVLDRTCLAVAVVMLRTPDPTLGGQLEVDGLIDPSDPEKRTAFCIAGVGKDQKLNGSLIGIGDGPLPWAS